MRYMVHRFRATETIDGVIRLVGRHAYTKTEMARLRQAFDHLNGKIVPKPGMQFKIPLPLETVDDYGNLIEIDPYFPDPDTDLATPGDDGAPEPVKVESPAPEPVVTSQPPPASPLSLAEQIKAKIKADIAASIAAAMARKRERDPKVP